MLVATGVRAAASAGPQCLPCTCTHCNGGCTPAPTFQFNYTTIRWEPTNVTLWWADNANPAYISLQFWNNSDYKFYSFSLQTETTFKGSNTIDYLDPNTTYTLALSGWGTINGCTSTIGYANNTYHTLSNTIQEFQGYVTGAGGGIGTNLLVTETCVHQPDVYGLPFSGSTATNSNAHYVLPAPGNPCSNSAYLIYVTNYPTSYNSGYESGMWPGHWNVSIVTWAPQVVNFTLPVNFLGPLTPMVLDFTNDNFVSFNYQTGLITSTTSNWSLNGQGESTSVTSSDFTQLDSAAGYNLEYYAAYSETGTVEFNSVASRAVTTPSFAYVGPPVSTNQSSSRVSDPVTPFYNLSRDEVCYSKSGGEGATYSTSYSGWLQLSSGFNLGVSVSLDLGHGLSVGSNVLTYSNSISNGGGQSWTLSYTIYVPTGGGTTNVWVYVQPGATNQVGPVVHAWSGPACPP
jgi:hypothetical protein